MHNNLSSRIVQGKVMHARLTPVRHEFTYPVYFYLLNLDEVPSLSTKLGRFLWGYNRAALAALWDKDYLIEGKDSLKEKVKKYLYAHGCTEHIETIFIITSARYFGYVFNPVNFYYCYDKNESFLYGIAEINNTFGERHTYILSEKTTEKSGFLARFVLKKEFHVSPFNDIDGDYEFLFSDIKVGKVDIHVNILKDNKKVFVSRIWGEVFPLSKKTLLHTILKYPFSAALSFPRIMFQAGLLYYFKKLKVFNKPPPASERTIKFIKPNFYQRYLLSKLMVELGKINSAALEVVFPNGESFCFGNKSSMLSAELRFNSYHSIKVLLLKGRKILPALLTKGELTSSNLTALTDILINNKIRFLQKRWSVIRYIPCF